MPSSQPVVSDSSDDEEQDNLKQQLQDQNERAFKDLNHFKQSLTKGGGVTIYRGAGGKRYVVDYNPFLFATVGVFKVFRGTVFARSVLWLEQLVVLAVFGVGLWAGHRYRESLQKGHMDLKGGSDKMVWIASFLLGFYTSLVVGRWWRLATSGVSGLGGAAKELCFYLTQMTSVDKETISAIKRYARASLIMLFLERRSEEKEDGLASKLQFLKNQEILSDDEISKLLAMDSGNPAGAVWTWVLNIIPRLHKAGKINDDMLMLFSDTCNKGRKAVELIRGQLGCPVPMPYVHLLGCLVKLANFTAAANYGLLYGLDVHLHTYFTGVLEAFNMAGRAFFIPLLFNAILLINEGLVDPFNGDMNDFPMMACQLGIDAGCDTYIKGSENVPEWLAKKTY